jgi:RimJ/RimL family protein N-acetyltransferase
VTPKQEPRVSIRPYELGDIPSLFEAARESRATVGPWLPWCHPHYAIEEARAWIERQVAAFQAGTEYQFVILSEEDRFLGGCGLNAIDREHRRANLGYWVRASEAGRGVIPAATRLLAGWAFAHTDLNRLEIVVATENIRSLRVAEKAGAVREGVLWSRLLVHGVVHDAVVFSFTRALLNTTSRFVV